MTRTRPDLPGSSAGSVLVPDGGTARSAASGCAPLRGVPGEVCPLDEAWFVRYSDVDAFRRAIAQASDSPERRALQAFTAWREGRLDEALELTMALLQHPELPDRWVIRTLNTQVGVLTEMGLGREAMECELRELEEARRTGDLMALATVTHDLGVAYMTSDPDRAVAQFVEATRLARRLQASPGYLADTGQAVEAVATLNLRFQCRELCREVPPGILSLADAEELCRGSWPELSAAIRAQRAIHTLEADEPDRATELAASLPDPAAMRDVGNASLVARARAQILARTGRQAEAIALLRTEIARLPCKFAIELMADLVDLLESVGEVGEALAQARRWVGMTSALYNAQGQTAVRALEVWHRTHRAEEEARVATRVSQELQARLTEINRDRERLRATSSRDVLTGLWNRQHLGESITRLGDVPGHQVALIDIDRFKAINDAHGHAGGDEALRRLASTLHDLSGPEDVCCRYGGDEFVVIRPAGACGSLADTLQGAVLVRGHEEIGLPEVGTSIGVACTGVGGFEAALDRADELMYAAKRAGGGRVESDPPA